MTLIRWTPKVARNCVGFHDEVEQVFSGYFARVPHRADVASVHAPAVDIEETTDEYILRADLPGISQKDVKVSLLGDILTLRGERKREDAEPKATWRHTERAWGPFERTFKLTRSVRSDHVSAAYRDGVLEVHIPKAEEARMREIEVQVG